MTSGFTYASRAVVDDRSNSRNSASTSWLVETGRPESAFATRRSCAGWRNENRRETATTRPHLIELFELGSPSRGSSGLGGPVRARPPVPQAQSIAPSGRQAEAG